MTGLPRASAARAGKQIDNACAGDKGEGDLRMEVAAFIISILAFIFSVVQFIRESSRQKKEATLVAYNELQDDVFSKLLKYPFPLSSVEYPSDEWDQLTVYLAKIERFSVGINTGIYSIRILNRLGGSYFIRQFNKLKPIINEKRDKNIISGSHYDEFEKTAMRLKRLRERKL